MQTALDNLRFETLGNATIQLMDGDRPVLATDPWLTGTCYFGSWALDHPLTDRQIANVRNSEYIWNSHGHPDHLHEESLALLAPGTRFLLPDHYHDEIAVMLRSRGFAVQILPYRQWVDLRPGLRVMCLDNMNQDAVLVMAFGDALLLDVNDAPVAGEIGFLRRLVAAHPNDKTYLLALCSVDADMFNFVDGDGRSLVRPPEQRKPPEVWRVGRLAKSLGVKNFCCSSSQHVYARADSAWANAHRITWPDMQRHWAAPDVRLIEPFVTVSLADGTIIANHPSQQPDPAQMTGATGEDDWSARLSAEEWEGVAAFFRKFELLRRHMDWIDLTVGGERRRVELSDRPRRPGRGAGFVVPRASLLDTVEYGYFDDLLIGNFMRVTLSKMRLYPYFTPLVAKAGGNAKVYTKADYARFLRRYLRRNPLGTLAYLFDMYLNFLILPEIAATARALRIRRPLEIVYRALLGDPVSR
jgi:hypothetical protein